MKSCQPIVWQRNQNKEHKERNEVLVIKIKGMKGKMVKRKVTCDDAFWIMVQLFLSSGFYWKLFFFPIYAKLG